MNPPLNAPVNPPVDQDTQDCRRASPQELSALDARSLAARYRLGVENFSPRVFELSDEQLDCAFLPDAAAAHGTGRWPARVLLGHLADSEVVYTHRIRRVACEDGPVLPNWDEDVFIDAGIYSSPEPAAPGSAGMNAAPPDPAGFVATIHTLRQWTGQWLESLDEPVWSRPGMHPIAGPVTLKDVVAYTTWHLEHHAAFLKAKIERFLGPEPEQACCGSNCACRGDESHSG